MIGKEIYDQFYGRQHIKPEGTKRNCGDGCDEGCSIGKDDKSKKKY